MAKKIRRKTIVNDPVHEVMDFGSDESLKSVLKAVVDTQSFQRLRRISQLGMASYVFPGATHTRFCHSLGVGYLANLVVGHLSEQEQNGASEQIQKNKVSIIASALLHDVGHGPFSHSFEHVLEGIQGLGDCPMHEDWTHTIISSKGSEINKALIENDLDPKLVASPFIQKSKVKYPRFIKQIVSSQLDVDRMDYLVRDSHFAGVSIGKIDLHYLINCLHIVNHGKSQSYSLGLTPKGVKTYESFVVARQLMNRSIYYHRKVKVLEYMVESVFREIIKNVQILQNKNGIGDLVPDYLVVLGKQLTKGRSGKMDKSAFMSENLISYLDLTEDSFWLLARRLADAEFSKEGLKRASSFAKMLLNRKVLDSFVIQSGKDKIVDESLVRDAKLRCGTDYDIVELKTTMYKKETTEDRVFVIGWNGETTDVSSYSEMISAFRDKPEVEKVLIVLDPNKTEKIEKALRRIKAI